MSDDHAIEAAKDAFYEREALTESMCEGVVAAIRAYLAAMEAEAVMVPREPTWDMLNAIWRAADAEGVDPESFGAKPLYAAMLAARPKIGEV